MRLALVIALFVVHAHAASAWHMWGVGPDRLVLRKMAKTD